MGGRGGSASLGNIDELEKKAKSILQSGSTQNGDKKNVFISFAYEDVTEVNLLRGQAKNSNNDLEFSDWSVREAYESDRAEYIKKKIKERIERSSVTMVYVSNATANSDWVNWEIRTSIELGKGVVAVYKQGHPPKSYPTEIKKNKIKAVEWTHENLTREIARAAKNR